MGESTPVPGQKKPAAQGWVGFDSQANTCKI